MPKLNKKYLSYIFAILFSPLPFLKDILVVEACANICPPIGFLGSAWKLKNAENNLQTLVQSAIFMQQKVC